MRQSEIDEEENTDVLKEEEDREIQTKKRYESYENERETTNCGKGRQSDRKERRKIFTNINTQREINRQKDRQRYIKRRSNQKIREMLTESEREEE